MTSVVSSKPDTDVSAEIVCLAHLVVLGRTGANDPITGPQKTEPIPLNMKIVIFPYVYWIVCR